MLTIITTICTVATYLIYKQYLKSNRRKLLELKRIESMGLILAEYISELKNNNTYTARAYVDGLEACLKRHKSFHHFTKNQINFKLNQIVVDELNQITINKHEIPECQKIRKI